MYVCVCMCVCVCVFVGMCRRMCMYVCGCILLSFQANLHYHSLLQLFIPFLSGHLPLFRLISGHPPLPFRPHTIPVHPLTKPLYFRPPKFQDTLLPNHYHSGLPISTIFDHQTLRRLICLQTHAEQLISAPCPSHSFWKPLLQNQLITTHIIICR